jgi:hypothetical protein
MRGLIKRGASKWSVLVVKCGGGGGGGRVEHSLICCSDVDEVQGPLLLEGHSCWSVLYFPAGDRTIVCRD